jgi:hypothetical protein
MQYGARYLLIKKEHKEKAKSPYISSKWMRELKK